ncbi:transcription factor ETV7 [Cololabis saira]|uniref:transcription factor ETV7 n=1 Tax=Cololabis saira TaxID=129043 RepID=UPI002AD3FFE3|nr:transcription factor ETV7 [Cololabis saira]
MMNISLSPLIKQENTASSMSLVMQGRQTKPSPSLPLSLHNQPCLVASPSTEDLWHLPGRLRINPSLWDKEDVAHWLHWAQKEYSLQRSEKGHFEMNGRALCLLTKEDFRRRCPSSGDVLYEILQCVKQQRRNVFCGSPNVSASVTTGQIQGAISCQIPTIIIQKPQSVTVSDTPVSPAATAAVSAAAVSSRPEVSTPLRDHAATLTHNNGSAAVSTQNQVQGILSAESIGQEPLNLSSREKPRNPLHKANGCIPECRLLWDYVYQLLLDDRYQDYIRWEDHNSLVFRVVDPNGLARLWGNHKNRHNMTYEKMSRALRHYYKLNIIKKERGQKLLFRFLKLPGDTKKQQVETDVSLEHTPPHDDFPDSSPTHKFHENRFEVSPDRSPPQPPPTGPPVR